MGAWGITALESDTGFDAVEFIRGMIPENGELVLGKILNEMRHNELARTEDASNGISHTGIMALAEIIMTFLDGNAGDLDYDEEWAAEDNKFAAVTKITADVNSIALIRDYLQLTLESAIENAVVRKQYATTEWDKQGGWRTEKDWFGWQGHMAGLMNKLDEIMPDGLELVELVKPQTIEQVLPDEPGMG